MLGNLPYSLEVGGKEYEIRTDFRDALRVIEAFSDAELTDAEKTCICFKRLYKDFDSLPQERYAEAFEKAMWFISCGEEKAEDKENRKKPKIVDWLQDEQLIFPAVNKVFGGEIRSLEYVHWWTFMGFFQSIDSESAYGYILHLRQKRANKEKFEKYEQTFWNRNRDICEIKRRDKSDSVEAAIEDIYKELLGEGGA